jgi:hypothetical protein
MSALARRSRRPALGPATCLTWSQDDAPIDSNLSSQIRSLPAHQKDAATSYDGTGGNLMCLEAPIPSC